MTNVMAGYFKPHKPGVFPTEHGYQFAVEMDEEETEKGIILYEHQKEIKRFPFQEKGRQGNLFGIMLEGDSLEQYSYNYYSGDNVFTDEYAPEIIGLEHFGTPIKEKEHIRGRFKHYDFDWEDDRNPEIPFENTILYGLNVRGFTMHKSSGVKHRGTFEGIIEKISYLKELGVTTLELMPCYEYEESNIKPLKTSMTYKEGDVRVNCWGFQKGYYFAPKASYSASVPELSFKTMVRELHKAGMEVLVHFYFPEEIKQLFMIDVLKYWIEEYHVDGFRISGFHLPYRTLMEDAFFKKCKIRFTYVPGEDMDCLSNVTAFRNIAIDNGNFRNDIRRFLKGDEGLVNDFIHYQRRNSLSLGIINYLCDYDGFSLMDLVSYERKHNEGNKENNTDGTDYNFSWNCGAEGESRKKAICSLRMKQLKNALCFLMLSQGTPFLFSGDEFGNSRFGNNNAYCQDNEVFWIKWRDTQFAKELLSFARKLIAFRKAHSILHMKRELRVMDSLGCGYPDISYHGQEAWRPDLGYVSRMVNVFLCGLYDDIQSASLYIGYNMHWENHPIALPKLPKGQRWKKVFSTEDVPAENAESPVMIGARSILVYETERI